jgi:Beta propeller domain
LFAGKNTANKFQEFEMSLRLLQQLTVTLSFAVFAALPVLAQYTAPAGPPTVEQRSAVKPGLWWDPSFSGHGFDIHSLGNQLFVVWYTYDAQGNAIWYTAQAVMTQPQVGKNAVVVDAALMKHRWDVANNRALAPSAAGTVSFTLTSAAQIEFTYNVNGRIGTWKLQPYQPSGATPERDYSGLWWNPAKSGYAWSLTQLHDFTYAVMYAYRTNGEPVWLASTFVNPKAIATGFTQPLHEYRGYCPGCAVTGASPRSEGSLTVSYPSEDRVNFEAITNLLAPGFAASPSLSSFSSSSRAADTQLAQFSSEANLHRYWAKGMANPSLPPNLGVIFPSASPPAAPSEPSFSSVNTQEADVDEPAQLRTDGNLIFGRTASTSVSGTYQPVVRVGQLLGSNFALRAEIALGASVKTTTTPVGSPVQNAQWWDMSLGGLYQVQNQLVSVLSSRGNCNYGPIQITWPYPCGFTGSKTAVEIFDIANPQSAARTYVAEFEGTLVSSRRVGNQVYVVTRVARNYNQVLPITPATSSATEPQRFQALLDVPLKQLLPTMRINEAEAMPQLSASQVYLPPQGNQLNQSDLIVVTRIPLDAPTKHQSLAIMGATAAVYVSTKSIVLATNRYDVGVTDRGYTSSTDIHQIAIGDTGMKILGTGTVEGQMDRYGDKASFLFSDSKDHLRVVTSSLTRWGSLGPNRVSILAPSVSTPGALRTVSYLPNAQRPAVIGKPGEHLYATRYIGDRLYAVTFKRIDPLYSIDLSDPRDPKILGEVELPGFSDYLHPISDKLLLGVGYNSADVNWGALQQGVLLTLFDVANAQPKVLQQLEIGKRGSSTEVARHHHALSALARSGYTEVAMPILEAGPSLGEPVSSNLFTWYGPQTAGLWRFRVDTGANPSISTLPALKTFVKGPQIVNANILNARSVLYQQAAVYFENGRFYVKDTQTQMETGPF